LPISVEVPPLLGDVTSCAVLVSCVVPLLPTRSFPPLDPTKSCAITENRGVLLARAVAVLLKTAPGLSTHALAPASAPTTENRGVWLAEAVPTLHITGLGLSTWELAPVSAAAMENREARLLAGLLLAGATSAGPNDVPEFPAAAIENLQRKAECRRGGWNR
jgi:mRNA-degrading endonuclease toxin of MazEF toxin-antitoxin module